MATNKMTTVKALDYVLDHFGTLDDFPADVREKLEHMKAQAIKKNSAERKPTAKELENTAIRTEILNLLRNSNRPMTISDIKSGVPALNNATSQRVSGIMRPLILGALVAKFVDKRITYFEAVRGI